MPAIRLMVAAVRTDFPVVVIVFTSSFLHLAFEEAACRVYFKTCKNHCRGWAVAFQPLESYSSSCFSLGRRSTNNAVPKNTI